MIPSLRTPPFIVFASALMMLLSNLPIRAVEACPSDCRTYVARTYADTCSDVNSPHCREISDLLCYPGPNPFPELGPNNVDKALQYAKLCNSAKERSSRLVEDTIQTKNYIFIIEDLSYMTENWRKAFDICNIDEEHTSACILNYYAYLKFLGEVEKILIRSLNSVNDIELRGRISRLAHDVTSTRIAVEGQIYARK